MDITTRMLIVVLALLITAFFMHRIHMMHERWETEKRRRLQDLMKPPEALVKVYMQRHWPGWSYKWINIYTASINRTEQTPHLYVSRHWKHKNQWHIIDRKAIRL